MTQCRTLRMPRAPAVLRQLQQAAWVLLVFLVPLLVNLWGRQPFELPKAALMRTIVWLLAGLAIAEIVMTRPGREQTHGARPLLLPVGLLALVVVVTTATAADMRLSLWGSLERSQGALTLLSYMLLALLAARAFHRVPDARRLYAYLAATTVPIVAVALVQHAGWDPIGLVSDGRSPAYATLGRSNFVGAYLALAVPPTLALWVTVRDRQPRILLALLLGAQFVALGMSMARSAWLAVAVALLVFVLLWQGGRLPRALRVAGWATAAALVAAGAVAALATGASATGSIAARRLIWDGSLALLAQRPLLGYGADALSSLFPQVYAPELVYLQGRDVYVDRAHNLLLDWALVAGLPGLLALLMVLATFAGSTARALRTARPPQVRALVAAAAAGVAANLANNMTSFDVTPTATVAWLLLGAGVALASGREPGGVPSAVRAPRGALVALALLGVGLAAAVWQFNVRPLAADILAHRAERHGSGGDWPGAIRASEQAAALWPEEPANFLLVAQGHVRHALEDRDAAGHLAPMQAALRRAAALRPGDPALWRQVASVHALGAQAFGDNAYGAAEQAYHYAMALAPYDATLYLALGRLRMQQGDWAGSAVWLRRAVALDATLGNAYVDLGRTERALGRLGAACAAFAEAARLSVPAGATLLAAAKCTFITPAPPERNPIPSVRVPD